MEKPFFRASAPFNLDRRAVFISSDPLLLDQISVEIDYGSLQIDFSEPASGPSRGSAQLEYRAIDDNPSGADDSILFDIRSTVSGLFTFQLQGEDLISVDPSLGVTEALLQSVVFSNASAATRGLYRSSVGDTLSFNVTSYAARSSNGTVEPAPSPVPLPASAWYLAFVLGVPFFWKLGRYLA